MDVLDDEDIQRCPIADLAQQRAEELLPASPRTAQSVEFAAKLPGEVEQRPERPRREQAVARAPGPAGCWQVALELLEDDGFTDSRLAAQQDKPAVPVARLACQARDVGECLLPFQQLHAASVRHAPAGVTLRGW
ncbi:MAG: hypothetical protein WBE95_25620 [Trebonia sp.]